jgi:hypothetical protein
MVGRQREHAIAMLLGQHGTERYGGMTAERYFAIGRK